MAEFPNVVIPAPARAAGNGETFTLGPGTAIVADVVEVGEYLAAILRTSTGFAVPVTPGPGSPATATPATATPATATPAGPAPAAPGAGAAPGGIALSLGGAPDPGDEAYALTVTAAGVTISANAAAGLFAGVQTLLQLLPAAVMGPAAADGPWTVAGGTIEDHPRFAYRGVMLDVSRHFFTVAQVRRFIDQVALYKVNHLHLHLTDDQGWRIAIDAWPDLTKVGGATQVGGGPGGYYTQADYAEIVRYAAARHITVVPEVDLPGHTNAALHSYAELNCDGVAPPPYTDTHVGFSSLCVPLETTYTFLDQVFGEIAALTPGPYVHIGGDEAMSTTAEDYAKFLGRVQPIVAAHGKTVVGWNEIAAVPLAPSAVVQFWRLDIDNAPLAAAVAGGTRVIMSPANRTYLDMKYTEETVLGQAWAGLIDVDDAYDWDPAAVLTGVGEAAVLGVEAPLWTETIVTSADIEQMTFPRLPAIAEIGWSPRSTHDPAAFRARLAAQAPRWQAMGIDYHRSAQVPWPAGE